MSPILLYTPGSCAFGSMVALEWLGEPYRLCRVEKDVRAGADYKKLNPLGQVPALVRGASVLTESFAILHHIGARDREHRLASRQGTAEFDHLNQVLSYLTSGFHPGFGPLFRPDRFADTSEGQEVVRKKAIAALPARYERLETLLDGRDWFVGEAPTIADAYFYGVARAGDTVIDTGVFKHLARMRERLSKNPAVMFAQGMEDNAEVRSSGGFEGQIPLAEVVPSPTARAL